jgi:hypothetical protein
MKTLVNIQVVAPAQPVRHQDRPDTHAFLLTKDIELV